MDEVEKKERLHNKPSHRQKKLLWLLITIVVIASVFTTAFIIKNKDSVPFPKNVREGANFPLYYPNTLPSGYELSKTSMKYDNGIVFYTLSHSNNNIQISEQSAPPNPPDFSAIQKAYSSFKKIDLPAGQAINGDYRGTPTAIMLTNTTLINISASKDTPQDVLVRLLQSLQSLPN